MKKEEHFLIVDWKWSETERATSVEQISSYVFEIKKLFSKKTIGGYFLVKLDKWVEVAVSEAYIQKSMNKTPQIINFGQYKNKSFEHLLTMYRGHDEKAIKYVDQYLFKNKPDNSGDPDNFIKLKAYLTDMLKA